MVLMEFFFFLHEKNKAHQKYQPILLLDKVLKAKFMRVQV